MPLFALPPITAQPGRHAAALTSLFQSNPLLAGSLVLSPGRIADPAALPSTAKSCSNAAAYVDMTVAAPGAFSCIEFGRHQPCEVKAHCRLPSSGTPTTRRQGVARGACGGFLYCHNYSTGLKTTTASCPRRFVLARLLLPHESYFDGQWVKTTLSTLAPLSIARKGWRRPAVGEFSRNSIEDWEIARYAEPGSGMLGAAPISLTTPGGYQRSMPAIIFSDTDERSCCMPLGGSVPERTARFVSCTL